MFDRRTPHLAIALAAAIVLPASAAEPIPPIRRLLPPEGIEIPAEVRSRLDDRLAATKNRLAQLENEDLKADVEVFTKAVELALVHAEFYRERDFEKADWALDQAGERLDALAEDKAPWTKATGLVVRGYKSSIDGSVQPYGLVIPEGHDLAKPCPLYVWLHGRGDRNTDLHFLQERATRPGQITPPDAIVVHPFGRHCVGWKHAGEIDVLEVVESVKRQYKIDADRVVLIGFSMGGAGAWHIGAHYTDQWIAVAPGAGFAETARYQRLRPENYPPWYEQALWGQYDVPNYVRNLFNTRVIAYSGELDRQIQAARVMEEAFAAEGRKLEHLIGPGVEHRYEPETLKELLSRLKTTVELTDSQDFRYPDKVHVQTRTLRYPRQKWVSVDGLEEHWKDARVDAVRDRDANTITLTTQNVSRVELTVPGSWSGHEVVADGRLIGVMGSSPRRDFAMRLLRKVDGRWEFGNFEEPYRWIRDGRVRVENPLAAILYQIRKRPGEQGPIDDAFMGSFVVVAPTGKSRNAEFQAWCDFELAHLRDRWRALMRAELPVVNDVDVASVPPETRSLILFGDSDSNRALGALLRDNKVPLTFDSGTWKLGDVPFDGNRYVPALIYPRPNLANRPTGYLVVNSGLTFREGHDRTNSLQNPKLPDWAVIDITQPPDAFSPGRIHDAGFFDEQWQLKAPPKAP